MLNQTPRVTINTGPRDPRTRAPRDQEPKDLKFSTQLLPACLGVFPCPTTKWDGLVSIYLLLSILRNYFFPVETQLLVTYLYIYSHWT